MSLTVGDVLEVIALASLATAAYLYIGLPLMLLAIGLGLGYLAQCYAEPLPRFKLKALKLRWRGKEKV